jgi:hypothetical protein
MSSIVQNQNTGSTSGAHGENGHAVCGPAVARTLSVIGAELAAHSAGKRPFWLTEPCPAWCEARDGDGTGHRGAEAYPDRRHLLFGAEVELSLHDADDGPAEVEPLCLWLAARQHYRAAEPDVAIVVPLPDRPGLPVEHEVRMTVAEARALRDGLTELLAALEGGAR